MHQGKEEIYASVKNILSEKFNLRPETLTLDDYLVDDLGADSLDIVELILYLEENYGVPIDEDQAEMLETVGDVVDFLHNAQPHHPGGK
ncbi:MAG: acyl carrier protein [Deltaproteobacteria bacterium]|nr:acyl carrier protein [Deltaproteobacteria bacterium]